MASAGPVTKGPVTGSGQETAGQGKPFAGNHWQPTIKGGGVCVGRGGGVRGSAELRSTALP